MAAALSACCVLLTIACAPVRIAPGAASFEIDAVLPVGRTDSLGEGWRLFRMGALRHARVDAAAAAWHAGQPAHVTWLAIAAPSGAFRPVQAVPGQRGYFHLVDAASGRLCLYDADAGLLSTFPLPREFTPFPAGRAAVFRGADGAFTFLDYSTGEAWQFADRQTLDAGSIQWIPRGRVKMPAGLRDCMQPPGSTDLFCRGGDGSALRFDGALNRVAASRLQDAQDLARGGGLPVSRALWDVEAGQWTLEGSMADSLPLFRFIPAQKRWKLPETPQAP